MSCCTEGNWVNTLWEFQEKTRQTIGQYHGSMLFVRIIGGKAYGFVGPSNPEYVHAVYDRFDAVRREGDVELIRTAIV